jgi:hypothetical protein
VTLVSALCLLIGTLDVVQLWIVAAALDAFLSGDGEVPVSALVASVIVFIINIALLWQVLDFDRRLGTALWARRVRRTKKTTLD